MTGMRQARALRHPDWLDRYEVVASVTSSRHCANFITQDQEFVFDLVGRIKAERSSANLCLGMLARLQPALLLVADRASEGLHPISRGYRSFDCFDTGLDHGGMGKVCVRLWLRDTASGRPVADATRDDDP